MTERVRSMSVDEPYAIFADAVDTDIAGNFQLLDGSNALGDVVNPTQAASEDRGTHSAFQAPFITPTLVNGFPAIQLGQEDSSMIDAIVDTNAAMGGSSGLGPASEDLDMADNFQTTFDTDASFDDFPIHEPRLFAHCIDQTALEITSSSSKWAPLPMTMKAEPQAQLLASSQAVRNSSDWLRHISETEQEPSRWAPASPQLQQHLNTIYGSQLIQNSCHTSPASVLYFPVQQQLASTTSGVAVEHQSSQISQSAAEIAAIDPSLLMRVRTRLPDAGISSNGTCSPISLPIDEEALASEDLALTLRENCALDAIEPDSETTSKRIKTTQDDASDDDDKPAVTITRTERQSHFPVVGRDEKSENLSEYESRDDSGDDADDECYDSEPSDLPSVLPPSATSGPVPSHKITKKGLSRRYEQQQESRQSDQRTKQSNRRRAHNSAARVKAPSRKMQNLLQEIEDSEGFVKAQGDKVRESGERDFATRRPVRKGARKSYVGQE